MAKEKTTSGSDLFIVDNSDSDWKVKNYLHEWADIAKSFDIATGYFEIGALLALDGQWQKLEKLRILMGDEVSGRTKKALMAGIESVKKTLDKSIEREKDSNEFLNGVPAIVEALRNQQIQCRVYTKEKFHAKAYITHAKHAVVGPSALVGSSNLTYPGLTKNIELNVQLRREVELLLDQSGEEAARLREETLALGAELEERRGLLDRHLEIMVLLGRPGPMQLFFDAYQGGELERAVGTVSVLTAGQVRLVEEYHEVRTRHSARLADLSQTLGETKNEVRQLEVRRNELDAVRRKVAVRLASLVEERGHPRGLRVVRVPPPARCERRADLVVSALEVEGRHRHVFAHLIGKGEEHLPVRALEVVESVHVSERTVLLAGLVEQRRHPRGLRAVLVPPAAIKKRRHDAVPRAVEVERYDA